MDPDSDHRSVSQPQPNIPFTLMKNRSLVDHTAIQASHNLSPNSSTIFTTITTSVSSSTAVPSSVLQCAQKTPNFLVLPNNILNQINMPLEFPTFYKPLHDQSDNQQYNYAHAISSGLCAHVNSYHDLQNLCATAVPYVVKEEGVALISSSMDSNQYEIKREISKGEDTELIPPPPARGINPALISCKPAENEDSRSSLTNPLQPRAISEEQDRVLTPSICHAKSSKKKAQQKRIICVPVITGVTNKATGECLHSDSWAWRKYGQKPIKGSPYPRGYYRCSSSKGCTARKQVERSRSDPNMLVITYTSDHNHAWLAQKNSNNSLQSKSTAATSHAMSSANNDSAAAIDPKNDLSYDCDIKTVSNVQDTTANSENQHVDWYYDIVSSDKRTRNEDYFAGRLEELLDSSLMSAARDPLSDERPDDDDPTAFMLSNVDPFNLFSWSSNSCVGFKYSFNW